ncbi:flagellar basal-body rod protein FlgG [Candidatus Contubernalis alkaliaceticus]|uniref:flagellar basal-body rod protein FlgG n=1 Tax=Candidatus Contubernalis alkaliaceticus TaxID=338645 RepID=UPI001F4C11A2|nr:flagellar basal-body rod protein FlgG [Candidatus Contubernalis alkalaceticus]UNC91769.1 flagellar basal-body rod protein FlgG [Candidatus Contubernalis alkalaceticus]
MIYNLWSGASGLLAQSLKIDTIANNIANVNTEGFKKKDATFQDLYYKNILGPGKPVIPGEHTGLFVGTGVKVSATRTSFAQGIIRETRSDLDFAIDGDGFFRVRLPDGSEAFTRNGNFYRDGAGNLVTAQGYLVELLPENLRGIEGTTFIVDEKGHIMVMDDQGEIIEEGRVVVYRFNNPAGLEAQGDNLWAATGNSGEPEAGFPGEEGFGFIRQQHLESSNVSLIEEMTRLIMAQRAFEVSSRSILTADEMWGMANQLRR